MNQRIKELEAQCWEERKYGPAWFDSEKFAKLIVRECAEFTHPVTRKFIFEHFGVEE